MKNKIENAGCRSAGKIFGNSCRPGACKYAGRRRHELCRKLRVAAGGSPVYFHKLDIKTQSVEAMREINNNDDQKGMDNYGKDKKFCKDE